MTFSKFQFNNFCYWPSNPKKIVEFIGGSYLATKPDLTYKRFIESLINKNYEVHAYKNNNAIHNNFKKLSNFIINLNIITFTYIVLNVAKNYCLLLNYRYECLNFKNGRKN